jgi:uncharacterized membrane protein YedE/YeeE
MKQNLIIGFGGLIFGFGLGLSTMTQQEVVLSFIKLQDLGLLLVMATAIVFSFIAFTLIPKIRKKSFLGGSFSDVSKIFSKRMLFGAIVFGIGWGLSGICPGSAIASLGTGNYPILLGIGGMAIGAFINDKYLIHVFERKVN